MATSIEHNPAACRAPRHSRVQHLVTADETSLAEVQAALAALPLCSTGRVFIEVPDATWIGEVSAPARMTVTWLDRAARSGAPGTGRACAPGDALVRAVSGWAGEMLGAEDDATRVILLGGYLGTAEIVDVLTHRHGVRPDAITTPARFGLATAR